MIGATSFQLIFNQPFVGSIFSKTLITTKLMTTCELNGTDPGYQNILEMVKEGIITVLD